MLRSLSVKSPCDIGGFVTLSICALSLFTRFASGQNVSSSSLQPLPETVHPPVTVTGQFPCLSSNSYVVFTDLQRNTATYPVWTCTQDCGSPSSGVGIMVFPASSTTGTYEVQNPPSGYPALKIANLAVITDSAFSASIPINMGGPLPTTTSTLTYPGFPGLSLTVATTAPVSALLATPISVPVQCQGGTSGLGGSASEGAPSSMSSLITGSGINPSTSISSGGVPTSQPSSSTSLSQSVSSVSGSVVSSSVPNSSDQTVNPTGSSVSGSAASNPVLTQSSQPVNPTDVSGSSSSLSQAGSSVSGSAASNPVLTQSSQPVVSSSISAPSQAGSSNPGSVSPASNSAGSSAPNSSGPSNNQASLSNLPTASSSNSASVSATVTLPAGAIVVTSVVAGAGGTGTSSTISETFIPTTYSSLTGLTSSITTTSVISYGSSSTSAIPITIFSGGVAWGIPSVGPDTPILSIPTDAPQISSSNSNPLSSGVSTSNPQSSSVATSASQSLSSGVTTTSNPGSAPTTSAPTTSDPAAGLLTFSGLTTPVVSEITSGVSGNGHTKPTGGSHPIPIFWGGSHFCLLFCPGHGGCNSCGFSIDLPPGIYPPRAIVWPPGWTIPDGNIVVDGDGTPTYDDSEPEPSKNPSNSLSSQTSASVTSSASSSSSSSCEATCSVLCATPTSATTATCSTSCYSSSGCGASTTTIFSTASGACTRPTGWATVLTGDDFSLGMPLGTADIASPSSVSGPGSISSGSATVSISSGASGSTSSSSTVSISSGASGSTLPSSTSGTGGNSGTTSAASATSKIPVPTCLADGAPWYSPTSWCDCGPSSTYPPLSATSGATSANCAYTTLPPSTIQPVSTASPPTNVPGIGGLPGCAAYVSAPGTSAYCMCNGTPAPTLEPTSSGFMNCDYTIQPTSSYNPAIPAPSSTATSTSSPPPPPPFATGKCNIHVVQALGQELDDPQVVIDTVITDAAGNEIGSGGNSLKWAETLTVDSKLPYVMEVTPQTGLKRSRRSAKRSFWKRLGGAPVTQPLFEKGPVDFAYGSQNWDTSSSQCSVGHYDNGNAGDFFDSLLMGDDYFPYRQMDCKFDCTAATTKTRKRRAVPEQQDLQIQENNNNSRWDTLTGDTLPKLGDLSLKGGDRFLHVRAISDRSQLWQTLAPKGLASYQAWQAKTGPDTPFPCNPDDAFNIGREPTLCQPARPIRPVLTSEGFSIDRTYYAIMATGPKGDNAFADFQNTVSPAAGVFLANANDRGAITPDPSTDTPGRAPFEWNFSSVAWWMWTKTVLTVNPTATDFSGLNVFFRREIANADTQAILNEAFAGHSVTSTLTWTPEDTSPDNAFWPLLASPNGRGIQYLLIDNKVAMHGKGITSLKATTLQDSDGLGQYSMWATIG